MMPEDIFLYQIRKAQEFINENSHADISRLHCLLRKIMPQEYHRWIDEIREKQSPTIFNIFGGTNTIASNAQLICQDIVGERALNQGYLHEIPYPFRPTGTLLQSFATNSFLQIRKFSEINIADPFFDSQRENYPEFDAWFKKKSEAGATAYTYFINGQLKDFLYLKIEDEELTDVTPVLPKKKRLKVGTFEIDNETLHTTRGERFMKKIMDVAIEKDVEEIYVTIFPTESSKKRILMFEYFGFYHVADKQHIVGKTEYVLVKNMRAMANNFLLDYPFVKRAGNKYVFSIIPEYHTKLFPDSIIKNEAKYDIIQDVSETNSIYKIYICWMKEAKLLVPGDKVVIYRTNDNKGPAAYRSACTSVCTICQIKSYNDFKDEDAYVKYTNKYSVFSEADLRRWYRMKPNFIVIKMLYNIAFSKKVINKDMKEKAGIYANYWGFFKLTDQQFNKLLELGEINERYMID